jgi:CTP:phosphocholine cytidylyltransferase-like protein/biotin operon repressor
MSLLHRQFQVLTYLEQRKDEGKISQHKIAEELSLSVGTINKALGELREAGFVDEETIQPAGYAALEPYRVKRAIFIAAGFGERLIPITLNTPKPLVRVRGVRIIDTLLDAVLAAGIDDITIVRGYLSEQFDQLLYKYPDLKFVENPHYKDANNISSMMVVRNQLSNAYVLESDLYLQNTELIKKYQFRSNYLGIPTEVSDDWCFETKNGVITKYSIGGRNCYIARGISYWDEQDGKRLAKHIPEAFETPGGRERFWDQVPLDVFIKEYQVAINPCSDDDITEIDTYDELKNFDSSYR